MTQVYIAVPVSERLPEKTRRYKCIDKDDEVHTLNFDKGNKFFHWPVSGSKTGKDFITHWLEPTEGVLLQTEELKKILNKYADFIHHTFYSTSARDSNQEKFISSLTSKTEVK